MSSLTILLLEIVLIAQIRDLVHPLVTWLFPLLFRDTIGYGGAIQTTRKMSRLHLVGVHCALILKTGGRR